MKVLVVVFMLISLSSTENVISFSELETLFTKFMQNRLSTDEIQSLQDAFEILRRPEPISATPIARSSIVKTRIECLLCKSLASAFVNSIKNGHTDEEIENSLTIICSSLGLFTHNVCRGVVALNVPIIGYIIRTTPEASARTFCGLVLQTDSDPLACPYDDPRFEWSVQLPKKSLAVPVTVYDEKPLKVALITDAHIDPLYEPFGVADCNEPTCCRKGQSPAKHISKHNINDSLLEESFVQNNGIQMLNLSLAQKIRQLNQNVPIGTDKLFRESEPAGFWGDYRNCDSPIWAFDDVIEHIKEYHSDIELLYYIGDNIDHGVWETSYESINKMNQYMIEKTRSTFGEKIQVIPVIGNHESQPTNQFAPASITAPKLNTTWLYDALADKWEHYLPDDAQASLRARGDFSVLVRAGLRVISLNNNVAYRYNWWLLYDPSDAKKHLDWLVQELYNAELKGEKVHILGHIPPGNQDLIYTWTREYNRIVNRFSSTIAAEFYGHTHTDDFKIFYNNDGTPINVAWGGGGIVAYSFYNLNYKIVNFDPHTFVPLNIRNYIYNLTEANLTPDRRPRWFMLYDMKSSFGIDDLSPSTMNDLMYSMVTNQRQLLDLYASFHSKLSDALWPKCNKACKLDVLCNSVTTVLWDRRKCHELKKLFSW